MRILPTISVALVAVTLACCIHVTGTPLPNVRPAPIDRKFNSTAVNNLISNYTNRMIDTDLATLFSNCFPNTLDTTVASFIPATSTSPPDSFLITGDIDAMWFRDSVSEQNRIVQ
jgi:hypothetical protein